MSSHHKVELVTPEVIRDDLKYEDHGGKKVVEVESVVNPVIAG